MGNKQLRIGNTDIDYKDITYDELIATRTMVISEFNKLFAPILNFGNVYAEEIASDRDIALEYSGVAKTVEELVTRIQNLGKLHVKEDAVVNDNEFIPDTSFKTGAAASEDEAMVIVGIVIQYTDLLSEIATVLGSSVLTLMTTINSKKPELANSETITSIKSLANTIITGVKDTTKAKQELTDKIAKAGEANGNQ